MKLVVLTRNFPKIFGGVSDYTYYLSIAMANRGHEIYVITSDVNDVITSHEIRCDRGKVVVIPLIKSWSFLSVPQILREIKKINPNWVMLQFVPFMYGKYGICAYVTFICCALRCFSRIKINVNFHEMYNDWGTSTKNIVLSLIHRVQFFAIGMFACKIFITSSKRFAKINRIFKWKSDKVFCIPVGSNIPKVNISNNDINSIRREILGKDEGVIITIFGTAQHGIYYEKMVDMLSVLEEYRDVNITILMLGNIAHGNINRLKNLKERLSDLKIDTKFYWTGYKSQEDISRYLSASDIMLNFRKNGLSTKSGVLSAAFAHSLCVVSNYSIEMDEFLLEKNIVSVFRSKDEFKSIFYNLISDPEARKDKSTKAHDYYLEYLTWDKIANQAIFSLIV